MMAGTVSNGPLGRGMMSVRAGWSDIGFLTFPCPEPFQVGVIDEGKDMAAGQAHRTLDDDLSEDAEFHVTAIDGVQGAAVKILAAALATFKGAHKTATIYVMPSGV